MKEKQRKRRYSGFLLCVSFVVIVALVVVFTTRISKFSTIQNVKNRVFAELKSTSTLQGSTLEHNLNEQYQPLRTIAEMIKHGETFASPQMQPTLEAMVNMQRLCMLGFADLNGDAISYTGEKRSNLSDRAYFYEIVNGTATQKCEYLATTKSLNEPRILFSIPAYQDGQMIGVLYCSKEVNVLEDSLFGHSDLFKSSSIIFICDVSGNMIVANKGAHEACLSANDDDTACCAFEQVPDLKVMYHEGVELQKINFHESSAYASLTPLGINDWLLGCIVDEATATNAYSKNISVIDSLTKSVTAVFILAMGYIILLSCILIRKHRREARVIRWYYENYRLLLREMNCAVVEYNPTDKTFLSIDEVTDRFGINLWNGSMDAYHEYKRNHQEFDFDELEKEIRLVQQNSKTYSFESIVELDHGEICWVRVILIPVIDNGGVAKIFGVVLDVSSVHDEFDAAVETFYRIPGGVYRYCLTEPIHLEYFSDGLCKMLGYTRDELEENVTFANRYEVLVHPDDRYIFSTFIHDLAKSGGTQTCEYRMVRKDGSVFMVSNTMDAKRSSTGIMYGYSIVTDLSKYNELQERTQRELKETRQQLEDARIKNSNSQMQPHFLYNALASIREIVLDDPEYASDLIYDFTVHLRACIRSMANDNFVPFSQELDNIKAYVNIEKMRFGDRMNVQYDCTETDFDIIPLSIQPLVENAIRHGIYERGAAGGTVTVSTARIDDGFLIQVDDDGVGFDFDTTMDEIKTGKRDSTGLFNLIFRFERLMKAKVQVESSVENGTKITIVIPIEKK